MKKVTYCIYLILLLFLLTGCGPKTFNVKAPAASQQVYSEHTANIRTEPLPLHFRDNRNTNNSQFSTGKLAVNLVIDDAPIQPIDYLQKHVIEELKARNLPVSFDTDSDSEVNVSQFTIRNHRTNAYTPYVTFSTLKAELNHLDQQYPLAVYVKRGKVPVWSFDEVVEPTINEPLAIVVKELAAKLNQILFQARISDTQVDALVTAIKGHPNDKLNYLKVYQLGFGNNPNAINDLVEFSQSDAEYVRLAAISSLGILKATEQTDYLWSIYEKADLWQDRAMALKALGDIGSPEAMTKLQQARDNLADQQDKTAQWFEEVLQLYIP